MKKFLKIQTLYIIARAVQDLSKLIRLKIEQFKKHKVVYIPQSNLYLKHKMVNCSLFMKSRQVKNNLEVI